MTVLGVPRDADTQTIQRAYRALAKIHHPDRSKFEDKPLADAKFRLIATAYEVSLSYLSFTIST